MRDPALLARLAQHRALASAPAHEHAWLVDHGILRKHAIGDVLVRKGEQVTAVEIVLYGNIVIRVDRGAGSHKIFEWRTGDVAGVMPYSRGAAPPADVVAELPTEVLAIDRELLPEMIRECPAVTTILVHTMVDRARQFRSGDHRDEKLLSLGKLAAGLAHELNNPASAAVRSAKALTAALDGAEAAARRLATACLSDAQLAAIDAVREACLRADGQPGYSTIALADREDDFATWLADHGASERCAEPLAETRLTLDDLDVLATELGDDALAPALQWLAAGCQVRILASSIGNASSRIHHLVGAIKGFTFMDHAPTPEPVDIRRGLTDTLTMLAAKARARSLEISMRLPDDLPRAHGVGAELNQVWMNLIDNALDAVAPGGHIEVTAEQAADRIVVRIIDDGPGIPPDIQGRIFDPFFTTKAVGEGVGLGLDIVRRLVQQHDGEIEMESRPGRTEFRVGLPVEKG